MRVTFNMMSRRVLDSINSNAAALLDLQARSASGKRILKPSDDVSGTGRAMSLRSTLTGIEQYLTNNDAVKTQLEVSTSAMDTVVDKIQRVRNIAVEAANSTTGAEGGAALIAELDEITTSLVAAGNSQYSGKYLFSGSLTNQPAIVPNAACNPPYLFAGNDTMMKVQVSPWTSTGSNVAGRKLFNLNGSAAPAAPDIFAVIASLKQNILDGDHTAVSTSLTDIDANRMNATAMRSEVGGRIATLESASDSLLDSKTSLSSLLSKTEDADMAQTIMDLQTRENMYQASVSTASKILNMSLADYFK